MDLEPRSATPASSALARERALELLSRGKRFVLSGHQRPDGDCLGAQAALASLLLDQGREVWIYNPDLPEKRYAYLGEKVQQRAFTGGDLPLHDVSVLLDFSELTRTGDLAPVLAKHPSKKLVVDHHIHHGAPWWDECYVDVTASATGLLVRRIARELGWKLDRSAAQGVFTSLVTDTGWFKYSNTDAETLSVAAEMIALGVEPSSIFDKLYQQRTRHHPAYLARLLARTEYLADGRLAVVDQPLAEKLDPDLVDSDELLDILRSVASVEVVLYLREIPSGACKLSARSKTDYDVNALARRFGGGGHRKASGATIPGTLGDVRPQLVTAALEGFGASAPTPR
ncbi:MAG: DHH family phosphoesterase [Planctomycetes bacterium]|nr:DHH family phosphoesterase [Planctomycetota bacterium]